MASVTDKRLFHPDFIVEPYWWGGWRPTREGTADAPPAKADVAIVGAGFAGLNAALELARNGASVVAFEAREFGHGAATRNGGGISGGVNIGKGLGGAKKSDDPAVEAQKRTMLTEAAQALAHVENLIARENIDCDLRMTGRYVGAFTRGGYRDLEAQCALLNEYTDSKARMLPRARQREEFGSDFYFGGMVVERSGQLHPARYYGGLYEAAKRAGAALVGEAPVERIERDGQSWRVHTPKGVVQAKDVVVTTNGYTGAATPALRRRFIPVASHMIATETIPPALAKELVPNNRTIAETKRVLCYYRLSPDGTRVLFGGRPRFTLVSPEQSAVLLHELMVERWPQLKDVRITHAWNGYLAFTFDYLPHMGTLEGMHYAGGCQGSGVAMLSWLGHMVARKIIGGGNRVCAFDGRDLQTRPFYSGDPWFLPAVGAWYRYLDRRDRARSEREPDIVS